MSHGYGWENRTQLLKSLSASLIAGFLYLMMTSGYQGFSPAFVFYAGLFSAIGFVLSGLSESLTPVWAIVSGTITGAIIVVQAVASGEITVIDGLLSIGNAAVMIGLFFAGYAAVYAYENREQLL